jgi:hypothetical protein
MPRWARCPRCGKKFKDDGQVLRHMAQPRTACKNYAIRLVRISRKVNLQTNNHRNTFSPSPSQDHTDPFPSIAMADSGFSDPPTPLNIEQFVTPTLPVTEVFLGAAMTYGLGKSFMDVFDNDEHACHRVDNMFYPFASEQDWELGSWLGRSDLSMASVDELLSLELVCFIYFC